MWVEFNHDMFYDRLKKKCKSTPYESVILTTTLVTVLIVGR